MIWLILLAQQLSTLLTFKHRDKTSSKTLFYNSESVYCICTKVQVK